MIPQFDDINDRIEDKRAALYAAKEILQEISDDVKLAVAHSDEVEVDIGTTPGLNEIRVTIEAYYDDGIPNSAVQALESRTWNRTSLEQTGHRYRLYLKDEIRCRT